MDKAELSKRWILYEQEKVNLAKENLTPEEYTRRIVEICDRLEI